MLGSPFPSASTIVREVEQRIRAAEASGLFGADRNEPTKKVTRRVSKATMDHEVTWPRYLELAGVASDGPLLRLAEYVQGPRLLAKGDVLWHKGEAPGSVMFIGSGLLSLWNEGLGHDQEHGMPGAVQSPKRKRSKDNQDLRDMLSEGTSRLLRIGPGWVLGGSVSASSTLRPPLVPLTVLAETEVAIFELGTENAHRLHSEDPALMLCLQELVMHFSGVLVRKMAQQLSDWHSLLYAA